MLKYNTAASVFRVELKTTHIQRAARFTLQLLYLEKKKIKVKNHNEQINSTHHLTESFFSWQLAISVSWPLRQVLYPSSKVKRTNTPATTWENKNMHLTYSLTLGQEKHTTWNFYK
jgi:hypothetical protein